MACVVSLADYEERSRSDPTKSKLVEALELFETVANHELFINSPFIVIFNKKDVFKLKLKTSPMAMVFPEYQGGSDYDLACEFLKQKIYSKLRWSKPEDIATFFVCALDADEMRTMTTAILDFVTAFVFRKAEAQEGVF